jgi:hypothetical protein
MPTRRPKRIALAQVLVGGCAVVFGVLIDHAQAQFAVPPPPPPVFNPSPPNTTVPQPSYQPVSPTTPGAVPDNEVTLPVNESLPRTAARSHRRTSVAKTVRHRGPYYRGRSIVAGPTPPYYYSPFAPYGCAWQRGWDGEWYRTSPCS